MSKAKKEDGIWVCAACNGLEFDIEDDPEVQIVSKSFNSCLIVVDNGKRTHSLTFVSMETVKRRREIESQGLDVDQGFRKDSLEGLDESKPRTEAKNAAGRKENGTAEVEAPEETDAGPSAEQLLTEILGE